MKRLAIIAMLALMAPAHAQETLPPGPAVPLIMQACVQCHDLHWLMAQRKTESAWRRTVSEMIWRGAPLKPGEIDVVTKYLATEFGAAKPQLSAAKRETAQTDPFAKQLPSGHGRSLVLAACVQCHTLGITVAQHKTLAEWRQSVDRMAHLGAKLTGSEIQIVAKYLARSFGPDRPAEHPAQ